MLEEIKALLVEQARKTEEHTLGLSRQFEQLIHALHRRMATVIGELLSGVQLVSEPEPGVPREGLLGRGGLYFVMFLVSCLVCML